MTSWAWIWLYVGAFLMLAELLAPGFVIFFFGLSAVTVGGCCFAIDDAFSPAWQLGAFSVFAILYLVFLRRWLKRVFSGAVDAAEADIDHGQVGRIGRVSEAIDPPLTGRAVVGDSEWTASADAPIPAGADVRVVEQKNLTLKVEPA